jgi:methionyl aminopeptidase
MRTSGKVSNVANGLIDLKDQSWLDKQRVAGKIAAAALLELEWYVKNKTFHSMATLDEIIGRFIIKEGGSCTFRGYKGFSSNYCTSINRQLVHGIADDTVLQNGDLVSFDLGVTYQGAIADTAITLIFGDPKSDKQVQLVKATEEALMAGIRSIAIDRRLGCIGNAISKIAKNKGYGNITQYGGHGLTWNTPHSSPFVCNAGSPNEGIRFQPNMTLAIEPMFTTGSTKTWVDKDGWTVYCEAEMSAHWEHTIFIHADRVEIITDRTIL